MYAYCSESQRICKELILAERLLPEAKGYRLILKLVNDLSNLLKRLYGEHKSMTNRRYHQIWREVMVHNLCLDCAKSALASNRKKLNVTEGIKLIERVYKLHHKGFNLAREHHLV